MNCIRSFRKRSRLSDEDEDDSEDDDDDDDESDGESDDDEAPIQRTPITKYAPVSYS